jgi:hypothetical protein
MLFIAFVLVLFVATTFDVGDVPYISSKTDFQSTSSYLLALETTGMNWRLNTSQLLSTSTGCMQQILSPLCKWFTTARKRPPKKERLKVDHREASRVLSLACIMIPPKLKWLSHSG